MSLRNQLAGGVALGATLLLMKPAAAQTSAEEIGRLQQQIQELQQKSQQLQEQLRDLQNQMQKSQTAPPQAAAPSAPSAAAPTQAASPPSATVSGEPRVTLYPAKGPAFTTADGQTSIQLASRMQFDVGDYVNVKPQSKFSSPANLTSGVNARRARIGILGKFYGDWDYALIYDFGGSADSLVNSGANTSGIENAYITYTGFRPLVIDAGYQNVPWTLDEATSSTDILFLERASPAAVAFNIAGGDFRSAVDVRYVKDRYFAGLWATGPVSGQPHNVGEQFGALGRFSVQALQSGDASLHLGVDVESLLKAPNVNGLRTLTLSDRPELRIDPTVVLNTGALINVRNSEVYGGELAASYQNLFFQSEYYHFIVQRDALPTLNFDGAMPRRAGCSPGNSTPTSRRPALTVASCPTVPCRSQAPGGARSKLPRATASSISMTASPPASRRPRHKGSRAASRRSIHWASTGTSIPMSASRSTTCTASSTRKARALPPDRSA